MIPVFASIQEPRDPPLLNFSRFSSLNSLFRVCALLFKFLALTRGRNIDCDAQARLYCLRTMQIESFSKELSFLKRVGDNSGSTESPPDLVNHLNLFLDDSGLIRSKGRLARSNHYSFEVLNPVLLGKNHYLTSFNSKRAFRL